MTKIITSLVKGQHTYEAQVQGLTLEGLKEYCSLFQIPLEDLKTEKSHYIPGHYFLGLFRALVPKIHKNDSTFPLSKLHGFTMSTNSTLENRVLINENLTVKMQLRADERKKIFWIEFSRESDDRIVLAGIFGFTGE